MANEYFAAERAAEFSSREESRFSFSRFASFYSSLSIQNQEGFSGRNEAYGKLSLVSFEVSSTQKSDYSSKEPVKEMSFKVKAPDKFLVHQQELSGSYQDLAVGGRIKLDGGKVKIELADDQKVEIDLASQDVKINSDANFQREIRFKGSDWQKTVLSSDRNTRIVFSKDSIDSIEQNGVMESFPKAIAISVGVEPRGPAYEELTQLFNQYGLSSLNQGLKKIERLESDARQNNGNKDISARAQLEMGLLLDRAALLFPDKHDKFSLCAENNLRHALEDVRALYGTGTPESRSYVEALKTHLEKTNDSEHKDEIDRLAFESKRAGLINTVIENIEKNPSANSQTMPVDSAYQLRMSLISMHIAGGDPALKSFIEDVNQRLRSVELVLPVQQSGPFRHGAILLTPEGATRYNGSFELIQKN